MRYYTAVWKPKDGDTYITHLERCIPFSEDAAVDDILFVVVNAATLNRDYLFNVPSEPKVPFEDHAKEEAQHLLHNTGCELIAMFHGHIQSFW